MSLLMAAHFHGFSRQSRQALEEDIRAEREAAMGDVRTHAAAAELAAEAAVAVSSTANTHDPEIDQVRTITSSKMKASGTLGLERLHGRVED